MRFQLTKFHWLLVLLFCLSPLLALAGSSYQHYLDYVANGGAYIDPHLFAEQHTLVNADPYAKGLCENPKFRCMQLTSTDSWKKLFPDYHLRQVVKRLNRTNVALMYRSWLLVPRDTEDLDYLALAPFPEKIAAPHKKVLLIDLKKFSFAAYNAEGDLVYWGPATSGKKWCTQKHKENCQSVTGKFKIYRIQGANCVSSKYPLVTKGGAPMPYCMQDRKSVV